ncbi:putative spermidine/putrescine transport system substrate-binding protein [Ancylobacter aquaticus]|uniref:Putative spermidine/putrescine transport system substrate-binding protein n=1 Tax=Ancylobacter aquaticus TaxID=100 RepID=A0A4R1I8E0_ANCAQ|nr:extracellular solute-binding protein [Ancylobacter aquaticus]TCK30383.1 putative spermidine/putrescine transport system substrate-binding protein [Ancylobacter aquaticus]
MTTTTPKILSASLSRRRLLKAGAATAAGLAAPSFFVRNAWAAGKTMQIGIWGGVQGEFIRKQVLPAFEKDFDCKVDAQQGSTLGQIALLRAGKEAPKFTVMFVDDLGVEIAKREGLIDPLPRDKMPNLAKVYPRFIYNDGYGVALAISSAGLFYNPQVTKPLESYAELWDPRFARKVSLVGTKTTPSVFTVIIAAAIASGKPYKEAQYLADQAWPKLKELKPNVLNLYSTDDAPLLVAQGQGAIGGPEYSKYVYPYKLKGASIDMCYPKEGAFAGVNCQILVKNAPNADLGAEFMNRMLDPAVQQGLAETALAAPAIGGLSFKPEIAGLLAYPESKMDELGLFSPDWAYVNSVRSSWIENLNQIFTA